MDRARLHALLRELHEAQPSCREVFERAEAAGVPLHVLFDHVQFDEWPHIWEAPDGTLRVDLDVWPEDWLEELVAYLGGAAQAQALLDRTRDWHHLDVARLLRSQALRNEIQEGVAQGRPLPELLSLLQQGGLDVAFLYPTTLRAFPLPTLLVEPGIPAAELRKELTRRGLTPELALVLFRELGDAAALKALAAHYDRRGQGTTDAERAISLLAALHVEQGRSLWELRSFAEERVPTATWLALFNQNGFSPGFCALAALEAEGDLLGAVALLGRAGLSDEDLYEGLVAAGAGPTPLLRTLWDVGWQPARLVVSLRSSGALDPEIREALKQLGLRPDQVGALLSTALDPSERPRR